MSVILITGSAGLIGSEAVRFFSSQGFEVVGIDNDMRQYFFGSEASTRWSQEKLQASVPRYQHESLDIRNYEALEQLFARYGDNISGIIHTAAQPSHDWAAREPLTDFSVNAVGTLNLLELTRLHCPKAVFIFTSTNKVYGDTPNRLPLVEEETRWTIRDTHPYAKDGIDELMSIDQSTHSVFGASKVAADVMVQEYGRNFGLATGSFRGGCLTGSGHSGAELHGFLAYLMKCAMEKRPYTIFGYKGKQVRDNIHSSDLIHGFWHFFQNPRPGEVYNMGGGMDSNCSMLEAIELCQQITGNILDFRYSETNRTGDHIWWISDLKKFKDHYPQWQLEFNVEHILREIEGGLKTR
ncbi:NAD-dependent epimerase/dehydratase [Magnetococcus marinus MC-1]|uniref:NAD-dependent epimerase/dehydratase n=1 Tax=Magnetococcus marinus (strain ATCC BAA-1437 / JCM 17883 / MC-1) TaxID=156889 RepID=A0LBM0_MAGMM|nr:NAD-dependent epimerase/dehydratase family protein [Magnetococcus marinus]ABK45363.1 NAD-dependent epimerase/dehydratase [Magnetococcus marinus MC-1]